MKHVSVLGGGPAGLMAADVISAAGVAVTVFDGMPSLGRKLLMAGRGGLNLTHSEPLPAFLSRYGPARDWMADKMAAFPPDALAAFAAGLGQETVVGSSGRVFPRCMKSSPLLRAWLARLAARGVKFKLRHRFVGFDGRGRAVVEGPDGAAAAVGQDASVLALGGASWPRLGSDGGWAGRVAAAGVRVAPLAPSNVGVEIDWTAHFRDRFAGAPLKRIGVTAAGRRSRGELVITATGLEGGAVYALSSALRGEIDRSARCTLSIDLRPDIDLETLGERLARPFAKQSLANRLRKAARLSPAAIALLREANREALPRDAAGLARRIKTVELRVSGLAGIERAISTAGGIALDEIDAHMMLKRLPGIFVAGEMLDWEAPTGGYLLQACFATGYAAGRGVLRYLEAAEHTAPAGSSLVPEITNDWHI